jgi:pimeloyl-ACP methyl ester carboxylesterase
MLTPIPLLLAWLQGLLSLAILIAAISLLYRAIRRWRLSENPHQIRHRQNSVELNEDLNRNLPAVSRKRWSHPAILAPLISGIALLLFTFTGRYLVQSPFPTGADEPREIYSESAHYQTRPDGTKIRAEVFGQADAPALLFTHGWGTSSAEWYYAKRHLGSQFRLIFWDLRGLGQSTQPSDGDFPLQKMAEDLDSVLSLADGKPVVLVGHSIGGMINLTFCRTFPDRLGRQVIGIAQVDTSYTNPVKTTKNAELSTALQKPVAEPLLHAMIWFSPLVRIMNWLSYQNGTTHLLNAKSSFAGSETRGQLDLISRYSYQSAPDVVARGTLAMFHWDGTPVLPHVNVPALIIVGQQDTTTLPSASERMRSAMPQATLEVVSPSAHFGLLEQNERYNSALERFASMCFKGNNLHSNNGD